jgi:putative phosphoesterase
VKIGIISDTHDNKPNIKKAMNIFKGKIDYLYHAGDIISPFSLKELFSIEDLPIRVVFGNNDGEKRVNRLLASKNPNCVLEDILITETIQDIRIAMTHGHHKNILDTLLESGHYDVVITGHTHKVVNDKLYNGTLHINPGEAGGWLTDNPTVAILDLKTLEVEIISL